MMFRKTKSLELRYPKKRVVITGATSGLGRALALEFARKGWRVAVTGRDAARIRATAEAAREAGGEPLEILLEVTHADHFAAAAELVREKWGGLDILINNAGIGDAGRMETSTLESWRRVMDANLWSVIHGCHSFIPLLKANGGGHILNVSSASGLAGLPEMASYNASKAAVVAISETLKTELVDDNIHVTVSCPSAFQSNIGAGDLIRSNEGAVGKSLVSRIANTHVTAEYVARFSLRSMTRNKLYSVPQFDARLMWRISRWFPEGYRNLLTYLFNKRLWVFSASN